MFYCRYGGPGSQKVCEIEDNKWVREDMKRNFSYLEDFRNNPEYFPMVVQTFPIIFRKLAKISEEDPRMLRLQINTF